MDSAERMQATGTYIRDYLEDFVRTGRESDVRHFIGDVQVPPSQLRMFSPMDDIDEIDLHKARFNHFYASLPPAKLKDFLRAVAGIEDAVVVEIGSWYGESFGLWVTDKNPSTDVHVYNPAPPDEGFAQFLFNELSIGRVFKMHPAVEFDKDNVEKSINDLYKANGLHRIQFHKEAIDSEGLERRVREAEGRPVVFFSNRTPTVPNEMTYPIAKAVSRHGNAQMVLMPLVNTVINAYIDDPIMERISRHHGIGKVQPSNTIWLPGENGRARLFTAMQQYYSLKIAAVCGAEVYRQAEFEYGFPGHQPTHFVSTIEPKA